MLSITLLIVLYHLFLSPSDVEVMTQLSTGTLHLQPVTESQWGQNVQRPYTSDNDQIMMISNMGGT